jgi:hypothetical protein
MQINFKKIQTDAYADSYASVRECLNKGLTFAEAWNALAGYERYRGSPECTIESLVANQMKRAMIFKWAGQSLAEAKTTDDLVVLFGQLAELPLTNEEFAEVFYDDLGLTEEKANAVLALLDESMPSNKFNARWGELDNVDRSTPAADSVRIKNNPFWRKSDLGRTGRPSLDWTPSNKPPEAKFSADNIAQNKLGGNFRTADKAKRVHDANTRDEKEVD